MRSAKYLILVKHSAPEVVESTPAREWRLSEKGRIRARELAEKLTSYKPARIVSSIEPKADETASILAENLGLENQMMEGLHEHDRSKSLYYSKDEFQNLIQEFFTKPAELIFGNETANEALGRFRQAVEMVSNTSRDTTIIVSHGTVTSLYTSWLTGYDGFSLWKELGLPSFVVLDIQSKTLLEIVNLN